MKNYLLIICSLQIFLCGCSTFYLNSNSREFNKIKLDENEQYQMQIEYGLLNSHNQFVPLTSEREVDQVANYFKNRFADYKIDLREKCEDGLKCIKVQIKNRRNCDRDCARNVWAITLLSLGIIPTWFTGETEISVSYEEQRRVQVISKSIMVMHLLLTPYLLYKTPMDTNEDIISEGLDQLIEAPGAT